MTRDAEMTRHRLRHARAGQHRHRDRRLRRPRDPELRRAGGQHLLRTRRSRGELRATLGGRPARAAAGRRAGQRPPADLRPGLRARPRTPTQALDRPRGAARRLARRSTGSTSTPTCAGCCCIGLARAGAADEARIDAELERDNTISGQERAAAARAVAPDRRGQGRGLGPTWSRSATTPQRDPPLRSRPLHAARPGGPARAVRREVPRGGRRHLGAARHPHGLERARGRLPGADGQPGARRPARPLARRVPGQPGRQALRARGSRRRRSAPCAAQAEGRRAGARSAERQALGVRPRRGGCGARGPAWPAC